MEWIVVMGVIAFFGILFRFLYLIYFNKDQMPNTEDVEVKCKCEDCLCDRGEIEKPPYP